MREAPNPREEKPVHKNIDKEMNYQKITGKYPAGENI